MRRNLGRRGFAAATIGALLLAVGLTAIPTAAYAAVETTLYVASDGSGTACTSAAPCSLSTAKSQVEGLTAAMTGDIVVELAAGTYTPTSTLSFGSTDSGENGHTVTYEAVPGQSVSISGAKNITGWTLHDSGKNIWEASVPTGFHARQLYVNGVRASLAEQNASVLGTITQTSTGYTITNSAVAGWSNLTDLDFHYPKGGEVSASHSNWTDSMCAVSSVVGTTVTMNSACYARATNGTNGPGVTTPTYIENNYALLSQPGQFFVDSAAGEIYYVPRSGETLSSATTVVPNLQTLVALNGTATTPVHDMSFNGITFDYATWIPGTDGVVPLQADNLESGTGSDPDMSMIPAAVALHSAQHVVFSGNTFTHLGGSGISTDGGSQNDSITGNVVTDVAGNGIEIGGGGFSAPPAHLESNITVNDNYVHDVADQYLGGVGIFAGYVEHTTIDHNEVWNVPYTGISLGWGWGVASDMVDNHVTYNYVHDVMNSMLSDGGAIYVNGAENSSPGSTFEHNYVSGIANGNGLYLDNASDNWTVESNVVEHLGETDWLVINGGTANTVEDNYADSTATVVNEAGNTVTDNNTGLTSWPAGAQTIMAAAGLEADYVGLRGGPATSNLAFGKTTYASSTLDSGNTGADAVDGDTGTLWSPAGTDSAAHLEVDLGASHTLSQVQVLWRPDLDQVSSQANFAIWVSNSQDMSTGHTVACTQGSSALPFRSTYECTPPAGSWRYVQVTKTDGGYFTVDELRVLGQQDSNVALNKTASASSELSGDYAAGKAFDGNTGTGWSPTGTDTNPVLEVDLGSAYTLSEAQIVSRQDLDQGDGTRENFAIWVSNNANMSLGKTVACTYTTPALPFQSTYSCPLPAGTWRYLAVLKTDGTYWFLPEVRVFGH